MGLPDGRDCNKCGKWKTKECFYLDKRRGSLRAECKECANRNTLTRYRSRKTDENDIEFAVSRLASAIISRVKTNKFYTDKGIENQIGDHSDIVDFLMSNFKDEVLKMISEGTSPSVDRINHEGHYSTENIRIIPLRENALDGLKRGNENSKKPLSCAYPSGEVFEFRSVKEAHYVTGLDRKTIRDSANFLRPTRHGYKFEFIKNVGGR